MYRFMNQLGNAGCLVDGRGCCCWGGVFAKEGGSVRTAESSMYAGGSGDGVGGGESDKEAACNLSTKGPNSCLGGVGI
jgi:hypothetical protein